MYVTSLSMRLRALSCVVECLVLMPQCSGAAQQSPAYSLTVTRLSARSVGLAAS